MLATMRPSRRRWTSLVLVLSLAAVSIGPADASPAGGTADHHFGSRGVVHLDLPGDDYPVAMTTTTTGRVAIAIQSPERAWLAMVTRDGTLDQAFGGRGIVQLHIGDHPYAIGIESAAGGGVLVAAWVSDTLPTGGAGEYRMIIAKFRPDGRLDRRFGRGGFATTEIGDLTPIDHGPVQFAVAPDGSVVIAAITGALAGYFGGAATAVLLKFRPDGSRDDRFGVRGLVPLGNRDVIPIIGGMSIDHAGRIVVGETNFLVSLVSSELTLRRFLPGGLPDGGFGIGGVVHVPVPGEWTSLATVTHDARGNVLAYGDSAWWLPSALVGSVQGDRDRSWSPYVARVTPSGQLDAAFGTRGVSMLHVDGRRRELLWTGDLLAPPQRAPLATAMLEQTRSIAFSLLRLGPTGRVDHSFGDGGAVDLPMSTATALTVVGSSVIVGGNRSWERGGTVLAAYEL